MTRSIVGSKFAKAAHLGGTIKALAAEARQRNAVDLAEDNALATVTEGTAYDNALTYKVRVGANGGTSGNTGFVTRPEWFRFGGGKQVVATERPGQAAGTGVQYSGYDITAFQFLSAEAISGNSSFAGYAQAMSHAWFVEFMFDGLACDVPSLGRGSHPYRFIVDAAGGSGPQYVSKTSSVWGGNNIRVPKLVFPDRRARRIRLEGQSFAGFCGVNVAPGDTVWAPPARPKIAVIGDSLTKGDNAANYHDGFANVAGKLLGVDFHTLADGGTGWVASDGGTGYAFPARLGALAYDTYDMVMFPGGYNDELYSSSPADVTAAVTASILGVREAHPSMPIVVLGAHAGNTGPSAGLLEIEAAIQAGVTAAADPLTLFVPMSSGTSPWISGTGKIGSTNGTGNSDLYIASDGSHCPEAGHLYKARRLEEAVLTRVVPWLCGVA